MGLYTAYDLPHVDAFIEAHMQTLKALCVSALGPNLKSIVLSGSFGRGEGSVLIHLDGSIEPLRDYDVRLIVQRPVPLALIDQIRSEFMQTTRLGRADERFSGEQGFSLTLEPLTEAQLSSAFVRDRDLRVYDHLNASRVIFGTDYSPPLRFPASEIPKVNGLRLLYQKMIGLVGHFAGPGVEGDVRRTLIYECDKTFVEICTALVLLADAYVPSYQARGELFERNWRVWFPALAEQLPTLCEEISRATQEKLYPKPISSCGPLEAFMRAREALLAVHRFYVHQFYGVEVAPGPAGCTQMLKALKRDYFRIAVTKWLDRWNLNYKPIRWGLNAAYHRLLRLKFARGVGQPLYRMVWETLQAGEAPLMDAFLAAWCALAAAGPTPDETLLFCAERVLEALPMRSPTPRYSAGQDRYLAIRDKIARAYQLCEYNG